MANIFQQAEVTNGYIKFKFIDTILLSSLESAVITLTTDEATPVDIANPIQDFAIATNYNTISRILVLYWNEDVLQPETDYVFTISGLQNVANNDIEDGTINFTTGASTAPDSDELEPEPIPTPEIIDYSIITDISFADDITIEGETVFELSSSDPADESFYIDNDYNNGRVSLTFNIRPNVEHVTSSYIKGFRKPVQRAPIRWEQLDVALSLDADDNIVYVDFPPTDGSGEYFTAGKDYFEDNYNYKIFISRNLGTG